MKKLITIIAFIYCCPVHAGDWVGLIVHVADGDTLTLLADQKQIRIRLSEIDAPERRQPFGTRSRQSLVELCHGKEALVQAQGKDRYGRAIGQVTCGGIDANAAQIHRGFAWVYDRYTRPDSPLYKLQEEARAQRRGLWFDEKPVPPSTWRRQQKLGVTP